eukprot:2063962-Prymnesium_polylepis.2
MVRRIHVLQVQHAGLLRSGRPRRRYLLLAQLDGGRLAPLEGGRRGLCRLQQRVGLAHRARARAELQLGPEEPAVDAGA